MKTLEGKTALVTGAHKGIGQAAAVALAAAGARVALADICEPEATAQRIREAGGEVRGFAIDVADEASVLQLFHNVRETFGALDILVNCAGIIQEKPLLQTSGADFDRMIAVNLRGTFLMGREAIRLMVERGTAGRVINIASDLSYLGRESYSPYVASKHGVMGLTRSWAKEFAPQILVNAICPGPIDTDMLSVRHMSPEWREKEANIPLQRLGQPQEIADAVLFLAGPGATFVTGQGLGINGGSIMP
ncbi:MAG: SDR family oxidoreductase [Oceanospirillaceae bacterium]|nr:SDR family oxidoreductase [Oceanospirillaceae bacterium]